jgi:hypothetical protein
MVRLNMKMLIPVFLLCLIGCQPQTEAEADQKFREDRHVTSLNCDRLETISPTTKQPDRTWSAKWRCLSVEPSRIVWLYTDEYGRVEAFVESENSMPAGKIDLIEPQ